MAKPVMKERQHELAFLERLELELIRVEELPDDKRERGFEALRRMVYQEASTKGLTMRKRRVI